MQPKIRLRSTVALLVLLLASPCGLTAERQEQVGDLVHALGYGGAVHQFKNYVLRGEDKYARAAEAGFAEAQEIVTALQAGADTGQAAALTGIAGTIAQYQAALPKVQAMVAEDKTPTEIDQAVKIDDKPAIEGLATLRGK